MDNNLNEQFKQIAQMLGQDVEAPDNLEEIISSLGNSLSSEQTPPEGNSDTEDTFSLEQLAQLKNIMDKFKTDSSDPRICLLNSLKPFLNSKRQDKVENCIKIMKMTGVVELLKENNIDFLSR